jgi:hypothetical protein
MIWIETYGILPIEGLKTKEQLLDFSFSLDKGVEIFVDFWNSKLSFQYYTNIYF